ncbi:MAG: glycosyl transferase family 1 [Sulfobacillus thermosulfidooxidans]|nr:MAG: glycosyl transferase family 1 [Sulfobacillus thermosulfidooxidans]
MTIKHLLMVGHYPLDALDRAPKVRIYRMAEAFARHVQVTLITGTRRQRGPWLTEAWRHNLLKAVDAVYVESASSTATVRDLLFLRHAAQKNLPVAVFVRDYYQKFPDLYPLHGAKSYIMALLYGLTLRAYGAWADILYVPTQGLGDLLPKGSAQVRLLPPGAVTPVSLRPHEASSAPWILYVGAGGPYDGVELLIEAMGHVHRQCPEARLALIMRRAEWPQARIPEYITVTEAAGPSLLPWYEKAAVAVIPRPDTAYTRLAWPVKLMDYLSYGIPVVVTDRSEAARFVERYRVGIHAAANARALAAALIAVISSPQYRQELSMHAYDAVHQAHSWDHRAQSVLADLDRLCEKA